MIDSIISEAQNFLDEHRLDEASINRLRYHVNEKGNRPIIILTAFRIFDESGEKMDIKVNRARNKKLEGMIRKEGYGFIKVKGFYPEKYKDEKFEAVEESYFVIGEEDDKTKLKSLGIKWGKMFNQDSIIYSPPNNEKAFLIGTNKTGGIGIGKMASIGDFKANRIGDMYSKWKGRTFQFREFYDSHKANSLNEKLMYKKIDEGHRFFDGDKMEKVNEMKLGFSLGSVFLNEGKKCVVVGVDEVVTLEEFPYSEPFSMSIQEVENRFKK